MVVHGIHLILGVEHSKHVTVGIASRESRFKRSDIGHLFMGLCQERIQILNRFQFIHCNAILVSQILPIKKDCLGGFFVYPWQGNQLTVNTACRQAAVVLIGLIKRRGILLHQFI